MLMDVLLVLKFYCLDRCVLLGIKVVCISWLILIYFMFGLVVRWCISSLDLV